MKKYIYECKNKEGILLTIKSDSLKYIKAKRDKAMFDETGSIYQKYFESIETINNKPTYEFWKD